MADDHPSTSPFLACFAWPTAWLVENPSHWVLKNDTFMVEQTGQATTFKEEEVGDQKRWVFPLITSGTWMVAWGYPGPGIFWRKHHQMVQNSASFLISDLTLFSSPSSINVECWENIIDNVPLYDVECWEHINVGFWINCKWSRDPPTRVAMDVWISLKFSMSLFDDRKRLPPNGLDGRQKAYEHMVVS